MTCNKCLGTYIGSTTRPLHERIHEHLNNDNSSVKKHLESCDISKSGDIKVKVLDQESRKGSLRIREAFYINKLNPVLNNKEENSIDLIWFRSSFQQLFFVRCSFCFVLFSPCFLGIGVSAIIIIGAR